MNEVRLDPRQSPARAELLLGAGFGCEAPGRPIHGWLESEDNGAGDPRPRLQIGAVRTRRLAASEAAARPSGRAYGNPLRGTRDDAPAVPVGAPVIARTDIPDARGGAFTGWRRTGRSSTTCGSSTTRPTRSGSSPSCGRPRRRAPRRRCAAPSTGSPATRAREAITRWLASQATERRSAPARPARGRPGGGGGARSRGKAAAHDSSTGTDPRARGPRRPATPLAAGRQHAARRRAADGPHRPPTAPGPPTRSWASAGRRRPCPRRAPATSRASTA